MGRKTGIITAKDIERAESLPALVKQLVKQTTSTDSEVKNTAAASLRSLATQNHGEYIDALFQAGVVPALVKLLSEGSAKSSEAAAGALHAIMRDKVAHQVAMVNAGGIEPLVRLLKSGGPKLQEVAASALASLQSDVSHQKQIMQLGCITLLFALLQQGSDAAKASAAQGLANAAAFSADAQNSILRSGAIPVLVQLLAVGAAQKPAAAALAQLARDNPAVQTELAVSNAIPPLLSLLNGQNVEVQAQVAAAIAQMAKDHPGNQAAIAQAGGIAPLMALLAPTSRRGVEAVQAHVLTALAQLARDNPDNQDAIARCGGLKPVVHHLETTYSSKDVQAQAAFAIMEITKSNLANQNTVVDLGGTIHLSALINQSPHPVVKAEVAGALWALSEDPENKTVIARAGTIAMLGSLLGSSDERAHTHAANALASIGRGNETHQVQITQMLLDLLLTGPEEAQHRAVRALRSLVEENQEASLLIAEAGNPAKLVDLLQNGIPEAKHFALWSFSLSIRPEHQSIIVAAAGVAPLIQMIVSGKTQIQKEAAAALAKLAYNNDDCIAAISKEGGVKPLIVLLDCPEKAYESDDGEMNDVRQNAAEALANLANDPSSRDEIVSAGGIRPLVSALKADRQQTKTFAAMALARLSKDHAATQSAIAAAGAIGALIALLDGKDGPEAQEEAAGALYALAEHELNRIAITESDGIGLLVMLLGCDNQRAREHAEGALVRLSIENDNRVLIIKKLVDMLHASHASEHASDDTSAQSEQASEQAAAALANLARDSEDNRKSIVDANGIEPLLFLLESNSSKAKENSVSAIKELCRGSREHQAAIARVGGIPRLVGVISSYSGAKMKESSVIQLCTLAASAIEEMAKDNKKNQSAITESGAVAPLVAMLGAHGPQMQANAAGALANLARNHAENQLAIAKAGAIVPLCSMIRDGIPEAQDQAASAVWALAVDCSANKDTIAKLGGIDPLVGLLVSGSSDKSQLCASSALAVLAAKHMENREYIVKRLVSLLSSSAIREPSKASRVLMTCSSFASDAAANQVAFAKVGGIPPLVSWLVGQTAMRAAHAMLCLVTSNTMTQVLVAHSEGIPPLIKLVGRGNIETQEYATRALWHIATQQESQGIIVENNSIKPLVTMLGAEGNTAPELAAQLIVRLARDNAEVCINIAEKGGVPPLVKLITSGAPGGQQQAAAALAELANVSKNRHDIATAGAVEPVVQLLASATVGTPEIAARVLANLSHEDEQPHKEEEDALPNERRRAHRRKDGGENETKFVGSGARRAMIHIAGGIARLVSMLDGTNVDRSGAAGVTGEVSPSKKGMSNKSENKESNARSKVNMQEHAAAALADIALDNSDMQDAIIDVGGVPPLLNVIRSGSQLGQEHAARAIRSLASIVGNQPVLIGCGTIPELVQLVKGGSSKAQEVAAAGLSDLGRGAIELREAVQATKDEEAAANRKSKAAGAAEKKSMGTLTPIPEDGQVEEEVQDEDGSLKSSIKTNDGIAVIVEVGGIGPLVALLGSSNSQARENAANALAHLAIDRPNQIAINKANGLSPLVNILDDGTPQAHQHASKALTRLATENVDNQTQIAKYLVSLLGNQDPGTQKRAAHQLYDLAANHPSSPVLIVNAGAISPLVNLLATGTEVREEVAAALSTLSLNSPSTQFAIATGLVGLVAVGSGESQESVTQLLVTLAQDPGNVTAISKSGAIPRLVVQVRGGGKTTPKATELAVTVLWHLSSASEDNVHAIAEANGVRPLVMALYNSHANSNAQANAAAVLAEMAHASTQHQNEIVAENGVGPLCHLLGGNHSSKAKAQAARALLALASGQPDAVASAGAIKPLVALLSEDHDLARQKAAGAIAALGKGSAANQNAVAQEMGIEKLVSMLGPKMHDEVRTEAAAALAVLANGNNEIKDRVSRAGGIAPLVNILQSQGSDSVKEKAAAAIWSLSGQHFNNQVTIAEAGGIPPLVVVIGNGSIRAQGQAAGALAALALDNTKNELAIAEQLVELLGSTNREASAKAALAISHLARSHMSNKRSIANAGGVKLLVKLLEANGVPVDGAVDSKQTISNADVQKDMASAVWSMAENSPENQEAVAREGGIPPLIKLLKDSPQVSREAAGALWSLAAHHGNQQRIAECGGIMPLISLLKDGSAGAQETAAGALHALAEANSNRDAISSAGGIPLLVALFDGGSDAAIEQAAGALQTLVRDNQANQKEIASGLIGILQGDSQTAQEHVTLVLRDLAKDPENRAAIAKAGAVPELVRQLEFGSQKAMGLAASALGRIALQSEAHRATVTKELVKLLASEIEVVRQRASEALRDMAADGTTTTSSKKKKGAGGDAAPLVNLLKDGLKDDNTEAQEYALWSLSSIYDTASKEALVNAGGIKLVLQALLGGKLTPEAQEHGAAVLSGLAPIGTNARAIKDAQGIATLVMLLSEGNVEAKEHAAVTLAQIATKAEAALEIAQSGAVSAFVQWLANPALGPPGVAARALSEIAHDNSDTQTQIAEEGAIPLLVAMLGARQSGGNGPPTSTPSDPSGSPSGSPTPGSSGLTHREMKSRSPSTHRLASSHSAATIKLSTVAAGALATLAKDHVVNQIMITEENGIPPLIELLKRPGSSHARAHESATKALWHLAVNADNRTAIARAGGVAPLVMLLTSESEATQYHTAAAVQSLANEHTENQHALAKAGAIVPLINLLGAESTETPEHAIHALLHLASHYEGPRNAVVQHLVAVLGLRNAAAQMKSAEALAVLSTRSAENRKAITDAQAIEPLVMLLGDGRRVRAETPQERAAAVLAELAKSGENKVSIVTAGGAQPLVSMLSSDSMEAQTHAAAALWHLSALRTNRDPIASLGCIEPLVMLLSGASGDAQKFAAGTLWQLSSSADNRVAMVNAGAIPQLVALLSSKLIEAREHAAAVISALARSQGSNKKAVFVADGIPPLIRLLSENSRWAQMHAASALWGLADGKEGTFDKHIVAHGGVKPLITIMQKNHPETRGFSAACLLCICKDEEARTAILNAGGAEPLVGLAHGPPTWLRTQAIQMLKLLGQPVPDSDEVDMGLHLPPELMDSPTSDRSGPSDADFPQSPATNRVGGDATATGENDYTASPGSAKSTRSKSGKTSGPKSSRGTRPSARGSKSGRSKKSRAGGAAWAIGDDVVARCKLKVRTQSGMSSTETGELPAGSRVRVFDWRVLEDGTSRASVAYANKPPMGWVSCVSSKDQRDTLLFPDDPEAVHLMRNLYNSDATPDPVSISKKNRFRFFTFQNDAFAHLK